MPLDNVSDIREYHTKVADLEPDQLVAMKAGSITTMLETLLYAIDELVGRQRESLRKLESVEITPVGKRRKVDSGEDLE